MPDWKDLDWKNIAEEAVAGLIVAAIIGVATFLFSRLGVQRLLALGLAILTALAVVFLVRRFAARIRLFIATFSGWILSYWRIIVASLAIVWFVVLLALYNRISFDMWRTITLTSYAITLLFFILLLLSPKLPQRIKYALWSYDFIEHFNEAEQLGYMGSFLEVLESAESGGKQKGAILEHPPSSADLNTHLTYNVGNIPVRVKHLQLQFFTGILDRVSKNDGEVEHSGFPSVPNNRIKFEIYVDGELKFSQVKDTLQWDKQQFEEPVIHTPGHSLAIKFVTNCMDNNSWNWAAWGEPKLVEPRGRVVVKNVNTRR